MPRSIQRLQLFIPFSVKANHIWISVPLTVKSHSYISSRKCSLFLLRILSEDVFSFMAFHLPPPLLQSHKCLGEMAPPCRNLGNWVISDSLLRTSVMFFSLQTEICSTNTPEKQRKKQKFLQKKKKKFHYLPKLKLKLLFQTSLIFFTHLCPPAIKELSCSCWQALNWLH